ncbi:hypothetical protein PR048_015819 [Dryococelus australis]|uniref:Uncharacterized protein n=1 Tax=Dryococelus australis TaxID=614101 RepID=A0ABQ9HI05_9NEOP|nr:hypothetical protein PR048_015819 [Dryococelus australis]
MFHVCAKVYGKGTDYEILPKYETPGVQSQDLLKPSGQYANSVTGTFPRVYCIAISERLCRRPHSLYHVDVTGTTVVQHRAVKAISPRRKQEVYALTPAERRSLITVVTCVNDVGSFVPPLVVWPRKNMKMEFMDVAPADSVWGCHPSGSIKGDDSMIPFNKDMFHERPAGASHKLSMIIAHGSDTEPSNTWTFHVSSLLM